MFAVCWPLLFLVVEAAIASGSDLALGKLNEKGRE